MDVLPTLWSPKNTSLYLASGAAGPEAALAGAFGKAAAAISNHTQALLTNQICCLCCNRTNLVSRKKRLNRWSSARHQFFFANAQRNCTSRFSFYVKICSWFRQRQRYKQNTYSFVRIQMTPISSYLCENCFLCHDGLEGRNVDERGPCSFPSELLLRCTQHCTDFIRCKLESKASLVQRC